MAKDQKFEHGTGCGNIHKFTLIYGYKGTNPHAVSVTSGAAGMWVWYLMATIVTERFCIRACAVTWR